MLSDAFTAIKAHLYERIASPLLGTFAVAWVLVNYRFLIVILSDLTVNDKFNIIDTQLFSTREDILYKGIFYPFVATLAYLFIYPFPAKWVFQWWRGWQKELKEIRQRIEDETPLTISESKEIRKAVNTMQVEWEDRISKKDAEINRMQQLLEARSAREYARAIEEQKAQPIFQPAGYDSSNTDAHIRFKNLGALIKNLAIDTVPKCTATVTPRNAPTGDIFTVHLKQIKSVETDIELRIQYDDLFNQRGTKSFLWNSRTGAVEIEATDV